MRGIELFLCAFVFDELQHARLRIYLFAFFFQLVQGLHVYVLKFDGHDVHVAAEAQYGIQVVEIAPAQNRVLSHGKGIRGGGRAHARRRCSCSFPAKTCGPTVRHPKYRCVCPFCSWYKGTYLPRTGIGVCLRLPGFLCDGRATHMYSKRSGHRAFLPHFPSVFRKFSGIAIFAKWQTAPPKYPCWELTSKSTFRMHKFWLPSKRWQKRSIATTRARRSSLCRCSMGPSCSRPI